MAEKTITAQYEGLDKVIKILIQAFLGWLFLSAVYRFIRYSETKNTQTLIAAIVCVIPGVNFVSWIVDLVTEIMSNRITVFAD